MNNQQTQTKLVSKFPAPPGYTNNIDYLQNLINNGMERRYGKNPSSEVNKRIQNELNVLVNQDYTDYMLMLHAIIETTKQNSIALSPGFGRLPGSIVAYCLEITAVDPLKYGLLFERLMADNITSKQKFVIEIEDGKQNLLIEKIKLRFPEIMFELYPDDDFPETYKDKQYHKILIWYNNTPINSTHKNTHNQYKIVLNPALCNTDNILTSEPDDDSSKVFQSRDFNDIVIQNAVADLKSNDIENNIIDAKRGIINPIYKHPVFTQILQETYGIPVFEEQLLLMLQKSAGFSPAHSLRIFKAMRKKKKEELDKAYSKFLIGCMANPGFNQPTSPDPESNIEKLWSHFIKISTQLALKAHVVTRMMIDSKNFMYPITTILPTQIVTMNRND